MCVHQNKSIIINHFVNDDSLLKLKVENLNFHSLNINQCIYISNIFIYKLNYMAFLISLGVINKKLMTKKKSACNNQRKKK